MGKAAHQPDTDPGNAQGATAHVTKTPLVLIGLLAVAVALILGLTAYWRTLAPEAKQQGPETVSLAGSQQSLASATKFLSDEISELAAPAPTPAPNYRPQSNPGDWGPGPAAADQRLRRRRELEEQLAVDAQIADSEIPTDNLYPAARAAPPIPIEPRTATAGGGLNAVIFGAGKQIDEVDPNLRLRKEQFRQTERVYRYSTEPVRKPLSPYEIRVGHLIPAVLIGEINSDLPGQIVGQVRRAVRDTATGQHVLIPPGTRVIGEYDSRLAFGQQRVMVGWHRLQFPNGSVMALGGMPGTDRMGAAGLHDQVNNHYWRTFGSAALISLFSSAAQLSIPRDKESSELSRTDILSEELSSQWSEVGQTILRKHLNVQPTLTIRPGYRFNILVDKDLIFDGPYRG